MRSLYLNYIKNNTTIALKNIYITLYVKNVTYIFIIFFLIFLIYFYLIINNYNYI